MASVQLRIPDPSLVLLIGPAGAGKSTFAARHFSRTEVVSSDHCRALLSDDEGDQEVTAAAFSLLHHIVRERSRIGRLTVVDATNLHGKSRRPLLRLAGLFNLPVVAIVFDLPLELCLARNDARAHRRVAAGVIEQQAVDLAQTLTRLGREPYEKVYRLSEGAMDRATIRRISLRRGRPGGFARERRPPGAEGGAG